MRHVTQSTAPTKQFKDKLREHLDRKNLKVGALIARFGHEPYSREFESERRMLHRYLAGKTKPSEAVRRRYEQVLELETGELDPDDEESDPVAELMAALMTTVELLAEAKAEIRIKSNVPAAHLVASTTGTQRTGGYRNDRDPDA